MIIQDKPELVANLDQELLINQSIYAWDRYLITGKPVFLTIALGYMDRYRTQGGDLYTSTEDKMNQMAKALGIQPKYDNP